MNDKRLISIVVPVKNEVDSVELYLNAIEPVLSTLEDEGAYSELIFVDDGSDDATVDRILERSKSRKTRVVQLSRSFGKEAALMAGLAHSDADAAITMDVDLQDPVELIPQMVAAWRDGADVVTGVRDDRSGDSALSRAAAKSFYRVFNIASPATIRANAGDYRLFDRRAIDAFLSLPERVRFNKGLFAWIGFHETHLQHVRTQGINRPSRWRFFKLLQFAFDGIFSFSGLPARIWIIIGVLMACGSLIYGAYIVIRTIIFGVDLPGYPSLLVAILSVGGLNMIGLGILGEYIIRIFAEVKRRPIYIVRRVIDQ